MHSNIITVNLKRTGLNRAHNILGQPHKYQIECLKLRRLAYIWNCRFFVSTPDIGEDCDLTRVKNEFHVTERIRSEVFKPSAQYIYLRKNIF